jgi:ribosomal protein S27AE
VKNTQICPKCAGREILRVPGEAGAFGSGNVIPAGATIFSSVPVTRYICATCGYVEEWIDSLAGLEQLRKKYGNG